MTQCIQHWYTYSQNTLWSNDSIVANNQFCELIIPKDYFITLVNPVIRMLLGINLIFWIPGNCATAADARPVPNHVWPDHQQKYPLVLISHAYQLLLCIDYFLLLCYFWQIIDLETEANYFIFLKGKGKVYYGQESSSGESTTTFYWVHYQLRYFQ